VTKITPLQSGYAKTKAECTKPAIDGQTPPAPPFELSERFFFRGVGRSGKPEDRQRHRPRRFLRTFVEVLNTDDNGMKVNCGEVVNMSKQNDIDRVWDIIEKVGVCMLTTQFADGLRARPLEARPDRGAGLIFFVTDIRSAKENEIEARPDVGLVFIDSKDKAYLSITGRAGIIHDADRTKAAWRRTDEVWWPQGPTDPHVCLLQIGPSIGELWDGPASAVATIFEFAKARLTGEKPNLGENRKVTVKM
jgi:general stress protein 26